MRERFLVLGVVILTILYLWIVRASYAPAIVVGEGRNECLTGNDCGSAWECLWPCDAGHLWGTDDEDGWECLWPCPDFGEVIWWQSWQAASNCAAELGSPAATSAICLGGAYCNFNWTGYGVVSDGDPNAHSLKLADTSTSNPVFRNTGAWSATSSLFIQMSMYVTAGTKTEVTQEFTVGYNLIGSHIAVAGFNIKSSTRELTLGGCSDTPTGTVTLSASTQHWIQYDYVAPGTQELRLYDNGTPKSELASMSCTVPAATATTEMQLGYPLGPPTATGWGDRVYDAMRVSVQAQPDWP